MPDLYIRKRVIARSGLIVRAGPGTTFDRLEVLPYGTAVYPLSSVNGWTLIDKHGDGAADGYVSADYLKDIVDLDPNDAQHIAKLLELGSTEAGLAAARETAKDAWKGYLTNGCAAHLSALLRAAGVDVRMELGAGNLAHILKQRGWRRVDVGAQQPGDVGVTYDHDPTPPGADHIYLVIETHGADEMLIADNQNYNANAPHKRFASGKGGKTPTEYFLRA
ncbi:MAG: SH3 domain-containing protein [Caulobacter sp.]|nr:SH3 domain-containing protein [Caulobacter sp.]